MATAYAALVSLLNNLDLIQNHPRHSFSFENKQIESLSENVSFLIEFMESYDNNHGASREAAGDLEGQIACAAHAAEDVIESHVVDQIRVGSTLAGKTRSCFLLDSAPPTSSTPLTSEKNAMVGFDDVSVHLMDLLTGEPFNLVKFCSIFYAS